MKQAVVFYTRDGSTRVAAEVIGEKFGADVFELEPVRPYGQGIGGFMRGGFGAAFGLKPALKGDVAAKLGEYGKIYIGSPLWAARMAPPLNTFLASLDAGGKEIVLFTLQADPTANHPASGVKKLAESLQSRGALNVKTVALFGAGVKKTAEKAEMTRRIDEKF